MSISLLDRSASGVYPIAITPFLEDGAIDFESLDRLTDFFLNCGVPGITYLGVLGEASKLSEEESFQVLSRVLKRIDGRARVIAGVNQTGFENFSRVVARSMDAGASGIMVAPAAGLKTEDQTLNWFDGLIRAIGADVPIALQDYPQNTGVFLSVSTLRELLIRYQSIKVIKHEEGSALRKISALREQETSGERDRVSILVGNSGIHLPQELHRGVDGANTGVAFPEMLVEVCRRFSEGNADAGEDLYDIFLPLVRHEQQPGIGLAIRKEIFRRRGLIRTAKVRAPGPAMDANDHVELDRLLLRLQRKLQASGEDILVPAYAL